MHNDYLLAPEKLEISNNMFSNYCSNIANEYGMKIGGVKKLVSNLGNKSEYVFHYKNLQLYFSLGIKLFKVHKILKFKACVRYFLPNFYFSPNDSPSKTMENVFYFI